MSDTQFDQAFFESMLKAHDWTYAYSDDHRYYVRGEESMRKIRAYFKTHGKPAQDLYDIYFKKAFPDVNEKYS